MNRFGKLLAHRLLTMVADALLHGAIRFISRTIKNKQRQDECHRNAIDLLRDWLRWAQQTEDVEMPHPVFVKTMFMVDMHGGMPEDGSPDETTPDETTPEPKTPEHAAAQDETSPKGGTNQ